MALTAARSPFAGRHHLLVGVRALHVSDITPGQLRRILDRLRATTTGCTVFTGAHSADGYGVARIGSGRGGRIAYVHRIAFALANGLAPCDRVIDHLCGRRDCANPDHLRAVTPAENTPAIYQ